MNSDDTIFKTYDIRGIYPDQLDEEKAQKAARVFGKITGVKRVVIGKDTRNSSSKIAKAVMEGLIQQGIDVFDIGEISTDCLYFSLMNYNCDGGIMITASHNPPQYNGLKMMRRDKEGPLPISGKKIGSEFNKEINSVSPKGKIQKMDIWGDYIKHLFSFIETNKVKPFRVVIDTSCGMAGKVIPQIQDRLPIKIIPLNFELDGDFPAHSPNPLADKATDQIIKTIKKEKADLGFIFDGDADRVLLIAEDGTPVPADITLLLLAKSFLENSEKFSESIVYNLTCSRAVPEFIRKWGGKPVRSPVGYINLWEKMREVKAILGGETSGHFAFRDSFYSDSAFIAFLRLLVVISGNKKKLSQLVNKLQPYFKPPKTNLEIKNKEEILEEIKKKYSDGKQDYLDGVTVGYKDWWFNVRPSNTEPLLRVTIEADNREIYKEKKEQLISFIKTQSK